MRRIAALALFAAVLAAPAAWAATHTIENSFLVVAYDDQAQTFSVKDRASGRVFLAHGRLDGAAAFQAAGPATDAAFGQGRKIELSVVRSAGVASKSPSDATLRGVASLELYDGVPFVFLKEQTASTADRPVEVRSLVSSRFALDLGKPAGELRTQGTGGLTAPDKNPGSYLFLALADPRTRRGVVAGCLTHERGDGVLFSAVQDGRVEFKYQLDYGRLRLPARNATPGGARPVNLETLAIGYFDDARLGLERFADAMARHYRVRLRPQVNGYCTWYAEQHGGAGDERSTVELARFAARELKPFGFSFVQIDDQWQDGGQYNGPHRGFERAAPQGPYAHGMKPVADEIRKLGLTAGIWFMPFARNHQAPEYKDRQAWFVKRPDGKPYETDWGGTSLDLTRPDVREHVAKLAQTIRGWGYNYFKMDGLWTGSATAQVYVNDGYRDDKMGDNAPFHDPAKTNVEVYRSGLKLVREAVGPGVFFSGCNVSQNMRTLGGSVGLVDSMRIGPDNGQKWGDYQGEIATNRCGTIITGPVRGTRLYFLHGRVWWNDPDPCYVRPSVPLNHARLITTWVALSGQFHLNSDWIPGLPAERLDVLRRTMPAHGAVARPVDYFDSIMPSIWLVSDSRRAVRRDVLGLFNWDDQARAIEFAADWAGLDPKATYYAFDFWDNRPAGALAGNQFRFDVPGQSCRAIAVRAAAGHPVVVGTSRHVTQGMLDVSGETWDAAAGRLSGASRVVGGDAYELRIAGLRDGGPRALAGVEVSAADKAAGVTIAALPASEGERGWLRVRIASKASREVAWSVRFQPAP